MKSNWSDRLRDELKCQAKDAATQAEAGKVADALESAIQKLHVCDQFLLRYDVHERSVTHRLAIYLEEEVRALPWPDESPWDVDCEYNKDGFDEYGKCRAKRRHATEANDESKGLGSRIYPDIIVHRRGKVEPRFNLLIVEVKKLVAKQAAEQTMREDREKLKDFSDGKYKFQLLLGLGTDDHWQRVEFPDVRAATGI